jgi:small subunit ribosomal protein S15
MEKKIKELAQQGKSPSVIGSILRDQHGIPKVKKTGKKLTTILKEAKVSYQTEKQKSAETIANLEQHINQHKHDYTAKKAIAKKRWQIKKLV